MLKVICYGLSWIATLPVTALDGESHMRMHSNQPVRRGMKKDNTVARASAAQAGRTPSPIGANDPKTLTVPTAGKRYFDLGRNASYEAAKRGDLPVIRIGSRLRVPIVALERMLEGAITPSLLPVAHPKPRARRAITLGARTPVDVEDDEAG